MAGPETELATGQKDVPAEKAADPAPASESRSQDEVMEERNKQATEPKPLLQQQSIPQSIESCKQVQSALNKLTGQPLLSVLDVKIDPDLKKYLLKQPDESSSWTEGGHRYNVTDYMRPGLYGQRPEGEHQRDRKVDSSESAEMIAKPDYFGDLKDVFGKSVYFDLVRNHNAVLSNPRFKSLGEMVKQAKEDNGQSIKDVTKAIKGKSDTVLINFDSHSDAHTAPTSRDSATIAQWVNGVLLANPNITEYYWVVPDNFKSDPKLKDTYFEHKGQIPKEDEVFAHSPSKMDLYLDKSTGALIMTGEPKDFSESKYRKILFNKVTIDELPNLKGRSVAASVDLDYFDNSGYDTFKDAAVPWQGVAGFAKFARTLKEKDIRVAVTTVSASPEYVRQEHARDLLRFASHIADATKTKMDEVVVPKQDQVYLTEKHNGVQVNRDTPALKLLFDMFKIDAESKSPTDSINLMLAGEKLERTISAASKQFSVSREGALKHLRKLDSADGNTDGVIQFEHIESLLQRACKRSNKDIWLKKGAR